MDFAITSRKLTLCAIALISLFLTCGARLAVAQNQKPNVVMLMTDDTGWNDFGAYGGGANFGHPTPNVDQVAQEGAVFTSWYGQASCTAGRASFMTGRIPIRSALSVVVVPGDRERPHEEHSDNRRVLPEERLFDLLLGQVASGGSTQVLPDRTWLRRNERVCRLLSGRLHL